MAEHQQIIIKKKAGGHGGGHHGGSWKVAYADFVTAMMAFFMVMWIMGLSADTKAIVAGYFNDPLGFNKSMPKGKAVFVLPGAAARGKGPGGGQGYTSGDVQAIERDNQEIKTAERQVKSVISQAKDLGELPEDVEVHIDPDGLRIELVEKKDNVFFDSGQATLKPQGKTLLHRIAPILIQARRKIVIEGHTDAVPFGVHGNWRLSGERALTVQESLILCGVAERYFLPFSGCADKRLLVPENPYDSRNRRVTIFLPRQEKPGNDKGTPLESDGNLAPPRGNDVRILPPPVNIQASPKK